MEKANKDKGKRRCTIQLSFWFVTQKQNAEKYGSRWFKEENSDREKLIRKKRESFGNTLPTARKKRGFPPEKEKKLYLERRKKKLQHSKKARNTKEEKEICRSVSRKHLYGHVY